MPCKIPRGTRQQFWKLFGTFWHAPYERFSPSIRGGLGNRSVFYSVHGHLTSDGSNDLCIGGRPIHFLRFILRASIRRRCTGLRPSDFYYQSKTRYKRWITTIQCHSPTLTLSQARTWLNPSIPMKGPLNRVSLLGNTLTAISELLKRHSRVKRWMTITTSVTKITTYVIVIKSVITFTTPVINYFYSICDYFDNIWDGNCNICEWAGALPARSRAPVWNRGISIKVPLLGNT